MRFGDFCNVKDQYDFISTLAFLASRRACRPTAVFPSQLTRSCTTPASREARRRAAVTPQPSRMSPYAPVRLRRAVRKGFSPRAAVTPQSSRMSPYAPVRLRRAVRKGLSPRAAVTPQSSRMSPYAPVRLRRAVRKGLSPRAAVTPQSICFPSSTPAPYGRGEGCRGSPPAAQSGVKGYYPL